MPQHEAEQVIRTFLEVLAGLVCKPATRQSLILRRAAGPSRRMGRKD